MPKKSKYFLETPFTLEVCNALRHHAGSAAALGSKRENAFEARDAAAADKHEAQAGSDDHAEACQKHSDAVEQIDELNSQIKFHTKTMIELARNADSPTLEILYDPPADPPAAPKGAKKKSDDLDGQMRIQPEAPGADGVDEHLQASPQELDLPGPLLAKLTKAKISTIAQIVAIVDSDKDVRDELSLNENQASELKRQLKKYRKDHRSAAREAETVGA